MLDELSHHIILIGKVFVMKKKQFLCALLAITLIFILIIPLTSLGQHKISMTLYADKSEATVDEVNYPIDGTPVIYKHKTYIPLDDVLSLCGFTLGWDPNSNSTVAERGRHKHHIVFGTEQGIVWVDEKRVTFETTPIVYNNIGYISLEMFAAMSDDSIYIVGEPKNIRLNIRDTLANTVVTDKYRLSGRGTTYKGITVV